MTTIAAALIGAVIGSMGSQAVATWFRRRDAEAAARARVVERHLLMLQDSAESLRNRLSNISDEGGMSMMGREYYRDSTLYAIGGFLAQKRRVFLDGVFAQLERNDAGAGLELRTLLEQAERAIARSAPDGTFQRYDRQELGEAVLEQGPDGWTVGTYLSFRERLHATDSELAVLITSATEYVDALPRLELKEIRTAIDQVGEFVSARTGLTLGARA